MQTCSFLPFTSLVPGIDPIFFGDFSENAPFSYGDNNHTLVTVERVIDHMVEEGMDDKYPDVMCALMKLPKYTYIDLES